MDQFSQWSNDITIDQIDDPLESIWVSNIILGMSSNLLVEIRLPAFSKPQNVWCASYWSGKEKQGRKNGRNTRE